MNKKYSLKNNNNNNKKNKIKTNKKSDNKIIKTTIT